MLVARDDLLGDVVDVLILMITAAQHGAEVGDIMKALERDPAFSRDERGFPQLLDAVATPAPAARGDDRRKKNAPAETERRKAERRLSREILFTPVSQMSPEQKDQALLALLDHVVKGPLTGLPTKAVWQALSDAGVNAFHISGDEFYATADSRGGSGKRTQGGPS